MGIEKFDKEPYIKKKKELYYESVVHKKKSLEKLQSTEEYKDFKIKEQICSEFFEEYMDSIKSYQQKEEIEFWENDKKLNKN